MFKTKLNIDKPVDKLKSRLVAPGFSQVKGIDFHKAFPPTSWQESIRILMSVMANWNWKARSLDIKITFFNGDLPESIFMEQSEDFVDPDHPDGV